mmetsp:Transcript_115654/g.326992  ORF Transcript_115654/g.326992 Transcript_115654/m.326992 type:complete len:252 (+) Transcript_115654:597-1352(+)
MHHRHERVRSGGSWPLVEVGEDWLVSKQACVLRQYLVTNLDVRDPRAPTPAHCDDRLAWEALPMATAACAATILIHIKGTREKIVAHGLRGHDARVRIVPGAVRYAIEEAEVLHCIPIDGVFHAIEHGSHRDVREVISNVEDRELLLGHPRLNLVEDACGLCAHRIHHLLIGSLGFVVIALLTVHGRLDLIIVILHAVGILIIRVGHYELHEFGEHRIVHLLDLAIRRESICDCIPRRLRVLSDPGGPAAS